MHTPNATHLRRLILALLFTAVFVRTGNTCSFSDDDDLHNFADPDKPYAAFVSGKLGIVTGDLRIRHMVIAYNILSGRGLTPAEQKAAIDVDQFYNYNGGIAPEVLSPPFFDQQGARPAVADWFIVAPNTPTDTDHTVPGQPYSSFANCLDDAYIHAAATLADRRKRFGKPIAPNTPPGEQSAADTPDIQNWIAGQQAVFSNCSDEPPAPNFRPGGQQPPPRPAATMPQPVAANAPLWLRQDRAYQIAAAQFYALHYDDALAAFRAIAADKASPWATLSRYVVARVLIRRAVVPYNFSAPTPADTQANMTRVQTGLAEARDQLQAILRDPAMAQYHAPAQHLLDYVMLRLDPAAQANELARRLTAPKKPADASAPLDRDYRQNVIDLTFAYNSLPLYTPVSAPFGQARTRSTVEPKAPLLRWINDLYSDLSPDIGQTVNTAFERDPAAHRKDALTAWRATPQPQWLAAALITATPASDGLPGLIAATRAVPSSSPVWATATYNRLRLQAATAHDPKPQYDELAALMPEIERTQPRSTINTFADLRSAVVPTLDLFLKTATRITPISIQAEPGEGFAPPNPSGFVSSQPNYVTLCNVPIAAPDTRHLDDQTAVIFNQRMPLTLLRDAALAPDLPDNVRFAVAHMAWTRALLLDQPEIAHALTPTLARCQPAFKQWLDQYDAAKSPDERHVLGLLALMRFTSTDPVVSPSMERDFAAYDDFRGNWWCDANQPYEGTTNSPKTDSLFSQPLVPRESTTSSPTKPDTRPAEPGKVPPGQPDPPFLTAADRAAVDREIAQLEKVGDAGDYFARQALAWVKAHPGDPHNPDVLGFAMRVVRNACRSTATKELNHQLFDTLHTRYPKSEWAIRYKTWE